MTVYCDTMPVPETLEEALAVIRHAARGSADILMNRMTIGGISCALVGCEGMISSMFLSDQILSPFAKIRTMPDGEALFTHIRCCRLLSIDQMEVFQMGELFRCLFSGFVLLLADGQQKALAFGVPGYDKRSVGEPAGEANVLGARDGFVESIRTNMSLLRRRLKTPEFTMELIQVGTKSRTDVCLCYFYDRVPPQLLERIRNRVTSTSLETLLSTGYLHPFLEGRGSRLFSGVSITERPDVLCAKLLEGRVAILIDGTPYAMAVPKLFVESFQTMDDYNCKPCYAAFIRCLKYAAFLISILLPGIYAAVGMHHPELLNSTLLRILAEAEQNAPLSLTAEAVGVLLMYEVIREAGLRLPKAVGGAVSIVGGLIIGDAAVSSGLISTPMLTIAAISVTAGYVVPDLNQAVTLLRLLFILAGGAWGLFGVALLAMVVLFSLCAEENLGCPATAPLSPLFPEGLRDVLIRVNFRKMQNGNFTVEEYHE